jgi:hypothetical protein
MGSPRNPPSAEMFGALGPAALVIALGALGAACNGTTGDQLVSFTAFAAGAQDAAQPFAVGGFTVQLTAARMRIGAVYFDESPPSTGFDSPLCIAPGVYAAQVPGPVEVDLLSSQAQEFSVFGHGSADTALSWQLWLTDGDVNESNFAHVVDLQGVATCDGSTCPGGTAFSFGAVVTINDNRVPATSDPAQPGENPVCKERIVQIGGIDVTFSDHGTLLLTIDPRQWFNLNIDFSTLPHVTDAACLTGDPVVAVNPGDFALSPETPATGTCGASGQPCCGAPATDGGCDGPLACTSSDPASGVCGPVYCIPDTSFGSGAGAQQGVELFEGILTGGGAAYSVTYSR